METKQQLKDRIAELEIDRDALIKGFMRAKEDSNGWLGSTLFYKDKYFNAVIAAYALLAYATTLTIWVVV